MTVYVLLEIGEYTDCVGVFTDKDIANKYKNLYEQAVLYSANVQLNEIELNNTKYLDDILTNMNLKG